jgi:hypothetical protein
MQAAGAKLVLVDMRGPGGPLVTDLADGRHPNDAGYVKMANIWFQGVQEVISKGLLTNPSSNSTALLSSSKGSQNTTSSIISSSATSTAKTSQTKGTTAPSAAATFTGAGNRLTSMTSSVRGLRLFILAAAAAVVV